MPGYAVNYVALAARDVDAVCEFLGHGLGLVRSDLALGERSIAFFAIGDAYVAVFEVDDDYPDEPRCAGVQHMALAAPAPQVAHGLPIAGQGLGPGGRQFVAVAAKATCGIRTRFFQPLSGAGQAEDGVIGRIDHLGIASLDNQRCIEVFCHRLGCTLESTQTDLEIRNVTESFVSDKYGAVYHARAPEILGGLRGAFITVGDCELAIMSDYDASLPPQEYLGETAGNTKGDQSAIAKFLAREGPGFAHIAFTTRDMDALLASLSGAGWRMIDQVGRPGGRGSRIGFVHPSNFGGGLLMHFVEPARGRAP